MLAPSLGETAIGLRSDPDLAVRAIALDDPCRNARRDAMIGHVPADDAVGAAAAQSVDGYSALPYEAGAIEAPDASRDWEMTGIDAKWLWSRFKSPRQFFEGNGKTALRKELEALIGPALAEWSGEVAERWLAHYASAWSQEAARAGDRLKRDLTAYADGRKQSLADSANVDELNRLYEALTHI